MEDVLQLLEKICLLEASLKKKKKMAPQIK